MKTEIEWTSVEDGLPDPGERVIASNGFFSGEAYIGYRSGESVWFSITASPGRRPGSCHRTAGPHAKIIFA